MNSERLMNEQRLALLKTIRKENPSLRRYMNDIINEMENPESAFNTGKMTQSTDLDRTTAIRLCDAFAVAKMYSEKYHLDFPELIEFVSEKTLEILADGKITLTAPFKERMKFLIRQQFPFQNPLLSRSGRQNALSYELADKDRLDSCISESGKNCDEHYRKNPELNVPILFTNNANIAYSEMEHDLETKMLSEAINKALGCLTPREKQVIQLRFGLDGDKPQELESVAKELGYTRERIRQIEAKAVRKLHSKSNINLLGEFLDTKEIRYVAKNRKISTSSNFDPFVCWQPYCVCKYQMRYRKPIFIDDEWKWVFCCQKCGRIYSIRCGKLKKISGYCLSGFSLNDAYDKKLPMFHWDKAKSNNGDFEKRYKPLKIRHDVEYYMNSIQIYYKDNNVKKEKELKIIRVYNLAREGVISVEEAYKKSKDILMLRNLDISEI